MSTRKPGYLVVTKKGNKGRTFTSKGLINEKVPVYLEIDKHKYSDKGILCDPKELKVVGFID